ncbi:MAG: copper-binding protein, partial [Candidatus Acidiferrales bacterium]
VRGTVILVNEATVSLMVRNDAVPGFLEPDDRVFGVNPASLLEGLEENDRVEFTLTERESGALVITALRKLED